MIPLPEAFRQRIRQQLGEEYEDFLRAMDAPPVRGIRLNPYKKACISDEHSFSGPVPWAQDAWYLDAASKAGASVLHEAGAYYLQEPGAMMPASVLDACPGEKILDLCAAPGGKSTQLGCAMRGEGLLVCNEPVPKRAAILSRNIERIGLPHTIVTCSWPEELAGCWSGGFDAVLADVPCSGEGMFRREPESRTEWSPEKAAGCARRQREILESAAALVRPGGRLVYSTCTYHPAENEENIARFLSEHPEFELEPFSLPGIDAPEGWFTCFPHRLAGEGQFAAKLRKRGNREAFLPEDRTLPVPSGKDIRLFESVLPGLPSADRLFGSTMIHAGFLPDLKGIRVLRAGLHLGTLRGTVPVPDHAAALCIFPPEARIVSVESADALRYMRGEEVPSETEGWCLIRYNGLNLGWGKGSGGTIKNHYPKALRSGRLVP